MGVADVLRGLLVAAAGALIALGLNWTVQHRAQLSRLREYRHGDLGGWQAWQQGFYDIRDWAIAVRSYLRAPTICELDFSFIRIPGPRYIDHLIRTERIPAQHVQQALALADYCHILSNALAHAMAVDWHNPRGSEAVTERDIPSRGPGTPALAQLAKKVEELAYELAEPERARRRARRYGGRRGPHGSQK